MSVPIDPMLAELGDYGGDTSTHKLLENSPASALGSESITQLYGTSLSQTNVPQASSASSLQYSSPAAGSMSFVGIELNVTHLLDEFDGDYGAVFGGTGQLSLRGSTRNCQAILRSR